MTNDHGALDDDDDQHFIMEEGTPDQPERDLGERFEVWPENWPAWLLFCRVSTQWYVGANGGRFGLRYSAVDQVMDGEGVRNWRRRGELLRDVQMIEAGALAEWAKKANSDGA